MPYEIKCYQARSGKNEVQEAYDSGTDELQAGFFVAIEYLAIEYLRVRERSDWKRPAAAKLSKCNEFRDFFEIRFKADHVQQRPIGFFGPSDQEFTVLIWATEKDNKFIPEGWCKKANDRRIQIANDPSQSVAFKP